MADNICHNSPNCHFLALGSHLQAAIESGDKSKVMEFAHLLKSFNRDMGLKPCHSPQLNAHDRAPAYARP